MDLSLWEITFVRTLHSRSTSGCVTKESASSAMLLAATPALISVRRILILQRAAAWKATWLPRTIRAPCRQVLLAQATIMQILDRDKTDSHLESDSHGSH